MLVDDQHDWQSGGLEPVRRFAHEAGGVGLCVGDEHELVGAVEGGAGGRRVQARAAVEHERADVAGEAFEQRAVGALVEVAWRGRGRRARARPLGRRGRGRAGRRARWR